MRRGVRIAVDLGTVRIGVARSDAEGALAMPVATIARREDSINMLRELVAEHDAVEVVVGNPVGMSGRPGRAAADARTYAEDLALVVAPIPVCLVDERLTTTLAHRRLAESGRRGRRARSVVDQAAAVSILQHALDTERATGIPAGTTVRMS